MLLYNYTSMEAAINIVRGALCFWGFRYDSMNDPTDFVFAKDIVLPELLKRDAERGIDDFLDVYPYIVSFCKDGDKDLMWRLYDAEVALVIDSEKFPCEKWSVEGTYSKSVYYNDVEYATEDNIQDVVNKMYDDRKETIDGHEIDELLLYVFPFITHKSYRVENEFRLVKLDTDVVKFRYNPSKLKKYDRFECEDTNDVRCAGVKDGMLRLYKEFYLPSECLKGIIIHAFDDNFQIQKKHLEIWLRQNGFDIDPGFIKETSSYLVRK